MPSYLSKPHSPRLRRGHPLARGLVGFWSPSAGPALRDAASGLDGTFAGSPVAAPGPFGACLRLDGATQYAVIPPDPALRVAGPYTVAAYFRRSRVGLYEHLFADWYEGDGLYHGVLFGPTPSNQIRIFHGLGTTAYDPGLTGTVFTDTSRWYHVVAAWDGASYQVFTDGRPDGVRAMASPPHWTGNERARIGDVNNGSEALSFAGDLDHVAFWSRALTSSEVAALYADPYAPVRPRSGGALLVGRGAARPTRPARWFPGLRRRPHR